MVGIIAEVISHYGLNREGKVDTEFLCTGHDVFGLRDEIVFVERVAYLAAHGFDEGVTHSAADDEVVNFGKEVFQNCKLG